MTEFRRYNSIWIKDEYSDFDPSLEHRITIASGPVIVRGGKVLLDEHGDDGFWKFPGGNIAMLKA